MVYVYTKSANFTFDGYINASLSGMWLNMLYTESGTKYNQSFLEYWFITHALLILLVFNTSDWGNPQCINDTNKDKVSIPGNLSYFGPNSVCLNSSNPVETCRYRSYRTDVGDGEYELNIEWFRIMVARLLFVLIFEVTKFW